MKKVLITLFITLLSIGSMPAKAEVGTVVYSLLTIGGGAVLLEAFTKSDPDALQKCKTLKKAENGNYNYAVYVKCDKK